MMRVAMVLIHNAIVHPLMGILELLVALVRWLHEQTAEAM